ncbi:tRNA-uridine aminocarboxypropyltransferase [Candidatus Sulfurimonas baltica]|uniref:tRNA-uridine aminocarboxypropyltransferase n=1 Tax=Candidatus Sulfurimonas baltica TaxID=2740404 RepID=A0A7S7RLU5_9BACT|nr:tRNA-uridine aminocarboxypropyltransferase [Candidatus Sulfurimonas baltica]QOY50894.1 DTW domain-containing protein [Candidatus Sulfurimonas baltica]
MQTLYGDREKCYNCYRPKSSCMCGYVNSIKTKTKFIILMHPKEFKKVKNGTGHLTHLSLENSELFIGIDFSNHKKINEILSTCNSYILYPSKDAINISREKLHDNKPSNQKDIAIFIIDSTWACSLKMLRESKNLQNLNHISFENNKLSQFKIKEQPADYCLSTIESTLSLLELLNFWKYENIENDYLKTFLNPFEKMVEYQLKCVDNRLNDSVRYKNKHKFFN